MEDTMSDEQDTETKMIPMERFNEVVTERNSLRDTVEGLQSIADSSADTVATVQTLRNELEEMRTAHHKSQTDWNIDRELLTAGITDEEGRQVARFLFSKLPDENRPELSVWLSSAMSDPSTAPRALAPYLAKPPTIAPPAPPAGIPSTNTGTSATQHPATTGNISDERIRELRLAAVRTGDWTAYREHRDSILKSIRSF